VIELHQTPLGGVRLVQGVGRAFFTTDAGADGRHAGPRQNRRVGRSRGQTRRSAGFGRRADTETTPAVAG